MNMKKIFASAILLFGVLLTLPSHAQVGVGTKSPDKSAVLDVSGVKGGFLPPRMSAAQRLNIIQPARGLLVYDNDSNAFFYFDGVVWKGFGGSNFSIPKLTNAQMLAFKSP